MPKPQSDLPPLKTVWSDEALLIRGSLAVIDGVQAKRPIPSTTASVRRTSMVCT